MAENPVIAHKEDSYYLVLNDDYLAICFRHMRLNHVPKERDHTDPWCMAYMLAIIERWEQYKQNRGLPLGTGMARSQWVVELRWLYSPNTIQDSGEALTAAQLLVRKQQQGKPGKPSYDYFLNRRLIMECIEALPEGAVKIEHAEYKKLNPDNRPKRTGKRQMLTRQHSDSQLEDRDQIVTSQHSIVTSQHSIVTSQHSIVTGQHLNVDGSTHHINTNNQQTKNIDNNNTVVPASPRPVQAVAQKEDCVVSLEIETEPHQEQANAVSCSQNGNEQPSLFPQTDLPDERPKRKNVSRGAGSSEENKPEAKKRSSRRKAQDDDKPLALPDLTGPVTEESIMAIADYVRGFSYSKASHDHRKAIRDGVSPLLEMRKNELERERQGKKVENPVTLKGIYYVSLLCTKRDELRQEAGKPYLIDGYATGSYTYDIHNLPKMYYAKLKVVHDLEEKELIKQRSYHAQQNTVNYGPMTTPAPPVETVESYGPNDLRRYVSQEARRK